MRRLFRLPPRLGPLLLLLGGLGAGLVCACDAHAQEADAPPGGRALRIEIDGAAFSGRLAEGPAAADFAAMLPLDLEMRDYASAEKIADPSRPVDVRGSRGGHRPAPGDMTVFAPWGNLAFFYRGAPAHAGLHLLGVMDAEALKALSGPGPRRVRIRRAD